MKTHYSIMEATKGRRLWSLFFFTFVLLFFILNQTVPFFSDDIWLINTIDTSSVSSIFKSIQEFQTKVWLNENGRFSSHLIWQILVNCGEIYYNIFITLVFASSILLIYKLFLSLESKNNILSLAIIILCIIYLSPNSESLFYWAGGGCHYLWPCLLSLIFLRITKKLHTSKESNHYVILYAVLSFLAGWTHEIFALPISFALFITITLNYIKRRSTPDINLWIIIIAYWIGALLIVISPGTWHRIITSYGGNENTSILTSIASKIVVSFKIFRYGRVFYIACLLFAILALRNQERFKSFVTNNSFLVLCFISSIAMIIILGVGGRAIWSIEFFSLALLLRWIDGLFQDAKTYQITNKIGIVAITLMIIHMTCLIKPFHNSWSTYKEIVEQTGKDGFNGTVRMEKWYSDCWLIDSFVAHPYEMMREDMWMRMPLRCEVCEADAFDILKSTPLEGDTPMNINGDLYIRKTETLNISIECGEVKMSFTPINFDLKKGALFTAWHFLISHIWPTRYPNSIVVRRENLTTLTLGNVEYYRFESPYLPVPRTICDVAIRQ